LFLPAANAPAERSFSAPKRVESYLRTTRAYERGSDVHHIRAWEDENTHAIFLFVNMTINLFFNLSIIGKQKLWGPVSVFVQPWLNDE